MTITISAFAWVPDFAQGNVKDLRPRWALEEAGLPYEVHLLGPDDADGPAYRAWQPFGQVPAYRDDEVELFESGAILLRIAELSEVLRPADRAEAGRVEAWVFAALNSVEPKIDNLVLPPLFHLGEAWVEGQRPHAEALVDKRLKGLADWLNGRDWLTGRFSVADIMMATVLRAIKDHDLLAQHPNLAAYLARCLSRPAFARALEAQLETFRAHEPV